MTNTSCPRIVAIWAAAQQALTGNCDFDTDSLSAPHFTLDQMIMTHLSATLDAPVILNSSLPGQRKLLLLLLRCCYCLPIHKDKVSWWPMMAPVWVPGRPIVAPLRIFSLLSPGCSHGTEYRGGERWMRVVWVLWKDVWNRSMGIKGLGSVGGLLCPELSPLLASMISSIDTEALLRSLCVFCKPHSHYSLSLFFSPPFLHPTSLYLPFSALSLWVTA